MARRARLEIAERREGASVTVALTGELDLHSAALLTERLAPHLDGPALALTLDLSELAFMDSSGLRLLIELHDRSQQEHWQLRLIAPQREAAALVLRATGADAALPFHSAPPS